jgi:hypothetical protein
MWKAILLAVALSALGPSAAVAQTRAAAVSETELQAACDRAFAARRITNPSVELRRRCLATLRARVAKGQVRVTRCWRVTDPAQRGWSPTAQQFARMQASGMPMCPGQ